MRQDSPMLALLRKVGSSRLVLPEPALAWILVAFGVLLVAIGTAGALRVRRRMWQDASDSDTLPGQVVGHLLMRGRGTLAYLLHEYDEPDKGLILLGLVGRVIGGLAILWGLAGLIWL